VGSVDVYDHRWTGADSAPGVRRNHRRAGKLFSLARALLDSSKGPPELPQWLQQLPWLGDWLNGMWLDQVAAVAAHGTDNAREPPGRGYGYRSDPAGHVPMDLACWEYSCSDA